MERDITMDLDRAWTYSKWEHYKPHAVGLVAMAAVGVYALNRYNKSNQDIFDNIYFASW
jgi:hypothetical protein